MFHCHILEHLTIVHVIASRTASAPWLPSAGPFFMRGESPCPASRGRCSSIVKRVVRSTCVPIAELPKPRMRPPSQCPGTVRSAASAGRWLIMISGETSPCRAFGRAPCSHAGREFPETFDLTLDTEVLKGGCVPETHRLVVRD